MKCIKLMKGDLKNILYLYIIIMVRSMPHFTHFTMGRRADQRTIPGMLSLVARKVLAERVRRNHSGSPGTTANAAVSRSFTTNRQIVQYLTVQLIEF